MKFEVLDNFKYFGVNVNNKNNMHQKVFERITSGNKCYKIYIFFMSIRVILILVVSCLYAYLIYVTINTTQDMVLDKKRWEKIILRNIYGLRFNQETNTYERRRNEELQILFYKIIAERQWSIIHYFTP